MDSFNPFSLKEKTILVTGASSGIGRQTAISCSKMGARLVITGRNEARLNETSANLTGDDNIIIPADLTDEESIRNLVSQLPSLDGIVHCAGIGHRKPAKFIDTEDIDTVMNTNFKAAVLLQSAVLQKKKLNKNGSVVFIASKAADFPSVGNAVYSASKGAIISYAHCLALELAPRNTRVNCICPAMVWTDLITQDEVTIEELKESEAQYPLKRYGKPEDIANLSVYLLSEASGWMTGTSIDITGGSNKL